MNKYIKIVLTIVGLGFLICGVFITINPETQIRIWEINIVKTQSNINSIIIVTIGLATLIFRYVGDEILKD